VKVDPESGLPYIHQKKRHLSLLDHKKEKYFIFLAVTEKRIIKKQIHGAKLI